MAKLKDLAGLAALGMLGYKLSKGKGESTTDTSDETSRLAARKPAPVVESIVDRPSQSTISGAQVNPDANLGEPSNPDYSNEGRTPSRTSTPKAPAATKPKPKAPVMSSAQNTALANAGKQAKMAAESDALAKANQGMGKTTSPTMLPGSDPFEIFKSGKPHPRTGRPMKNGGAVKKMAKGGMTSKVSSASSRADGIASRGKTRCKMY
jgi:hypothetical protein